MKRDMDLVRTILKTCADATEPVDASVFVDETHSMQLIVFRGGSIWFFVIGDLGPNVFTPYPTWVDVLRNINPLEVLSAEGYYMRKAKGKL